MGKIFTILFLLLYFTSSAQKEKKRNIKLQDPQLQTFIAANKQLRYIEFKKNDIGELELRPDSVIQTIKGIIYENWYSFDFLGSKYLFEKQFGEFPQSALLKKLDSLTPKNSDYNWYEGKIYTDHIQIHIESSFSTKRIPVFRAVRRHIEYPGGTAAFTQFLQSKIPAGVELLPPGQADSVLFFWALLMKKDSMIHEVRPFDSTVSRLSGIIQAALKETKGWTPFYTGGFYVNNYAVIYVRLRKDGTIEADYRR